MKRTNLQKAVICLGLNDKRTKKQEIETGRAAEILSGLLCERFAGATVTTCAGIYTYDNGDQVRENSFSIVLYFVTLEQVREFAGELCRVFNQDCVTVETVRRGFFGDRLSVEFYSPAE